MNAVVMTAGLRLDAAADTALKAAARFWFVTAVAGQWIFVYYIVSFYGGVAAQGNLAAWNEVLPHGYVPGNSMGNVVLAGHVVYAAIITVGGPLQLVPQIRSGFPAFHRWNGRIYMLTAFTMAVSGLYLTWSGRTVVGDTSQHAAVNINAVLIMLFAVLALRHVLARDFRTHRRWALRLFLVINGVWFFRVGLMFWLFLNQGPAGFDPETFEGPVLTVLGFAQFLVPLTVLEMYLRTQERAGTAGRFTMAAGLLVLTLAMGLGIFAATMGMWLPKL